MDDYVEKARKYATDFLCKSFHSYVGEKNSDECYMALKDTIKDNVNTMIDHLPKVLPVGVPMVPCKCLPSNCVAAIKTDKDGNYLFDVEHNKDTGNFSVKFDLDVYQFSEENSEKE